MDLHPQLAAVMKGSASQYSAAAAAAAGNCSTIRSGSMMSMVAMVSTPIRNMRAMMMTMVDDVMVIRDRKIQWKAAQTRRDHELIIGQAAVDNVVIHGDGDDGDGDGDGDGRLSSSCRSSGAAAAFQMPLHYPRFSRAEYEAMPEWQLDRLLLDYGLPTSGSRHHKQCFAIATFLWTSS